MLYLTIAGISPASADDAAALLKGSDVAAFVSLWPGVAKALVDADPQFDPALTNALSSQLAEMAAGDTENSNLDLAVSLAGFANFETFASLASRILTAAQWARDAPDDADLATAIGAVEADTMRTVEEKAEIAGALKQAYAAALAARPPDADIATVRPFVSAIEKAIAVDERARG